MANSLVPQLYVGLGFRAFREHGGFHLLRIENEHPPLSSSAHDDSAFFFDEAAFLVESHLHPLLNHLADRDQILCDGGKMQDIFNDVWLPLSPNGTLPMCRIGCVVSSPVST